MGILSSLFGLKETAPASIEKHTKKMEKGSPPPPQHTVLPIELPQGCSKDACGYFNLAPYEVTGHIINAKTGRKNKKSIKVNAMDCDDAKTAADECGILGPYTVTLMVQCDEPPNKYQLASAQEYGLAIPKGAVDADVRAMVEDYGQPHPTVSFASYCTRKRVRFSRFIGEHTLTTLALDVCSDRDKLLIYSHAVFCKIEKKALTNPEEDSRCVAFANSAPVDILEKIKEYGTWNYDRLSPESEIWKAIMMFAKE